VARVVEGTRANLQDSQHGLKSTGELGLVYGFALTVGKNVAVGLYTQRVISAGYVVGSETEVKQTSE